VACQFGVMFFPDKVQGYRAARRVPKPGGHFLFNAWETSPVFSGGVIRIEEGMPVNLEASVRSRGSIVDFSELRPETGYLQRPVRPRYIRRVSAAADHILCARTGRRRRGLHGGPCGDGLHAAGRRKRLRARNPVPH
jgi:hypothetical protein